MIFLDTSAIFALADTADPNHSRAKQRFNHAIGAGEDLLLHNYILVEAAALLQRRLGLTAALRFLGDADSFVLHWLTSEEHHRAVELFKKRALRGLSLVDCASFVVMRRYGVTQAIAFDPDFEREGFTPY